MASVHLTWRHPRYSWRQCAAAGRRSGRYITSSVVGTGTPDDGDALREVNGQLDDAFGLVQGLFVGEYGVVRQSFADAEDTAIRGAAIAATAAVQLLPLPATPLPEPAKRLVGAGALSPPTLP